MKALIFWQGVYWAVIIGIGSVFSIDTLAEVFCQVIIALILATWTTGEVID